jgi:hypothetical protein
MRFQSALVAIILCISGTLRAQNQPLSYDKDVLPLLQKYCYQCHGNGQHKSDLALDEFKTTDAMLARREIWQTVAAYVRSSEMPPPESKLQPTLAEREVIQQWIKRDLFKQTADKPDPGRVTIRRLNRAEYNNTIRDLLGVDFQAAEDFPSDDSGYGFDNIGDVLSLPPVLMEKYLAAATRVLDEAIVTEPPKSRIRKYNANLMEMGFNAVGDRGDGWMPLATLEEDCLATAISVPAGDYIIRTYAYVRGLAGGAGAQGQGQRGAGRRGGQRGIGAGGARGANPAENAAAQDEQVEEAEPAAPIVAAPAARPGILSLQVDDTQIHDWSVAATEQEPGVYETRVGVTAGRHRFKVLNRRLRGGDNELIMKNGRMGREQGATLMVKWVEIEGPLPSATRRYPASTLETKGEGTTLPSGTRLLAHDGEVATKFNVAKEGEYLLRVQAYADQAGTESAKMDLRIDGQSISTIDVLAPGKLVPIAGQRVFSLELLNPLPYVYEIRQKLSPGEKRFSAAFINDFADAGNENPNLRDRNLYIDFMEVVALDEPQPLAPMPAELAGYFAGKQITLQNKQEMARQILTDFIRHAWRRPVQASEVDGFLQLFELADKNGEPFEAAMKLPLKAVLISPYFLFRGEIQPDPNNPDSIHAVDEHSLASRLSYFLWSAGSPNARFAEIQRAGGKFFRTMAPDAQSQVCGARQISLSRL